MNGHRLCQYLDWDSDFFGCRIARIVSEGIDPAAVSDILGWCQDELIDCLYFLADASDRMSIVSAEDNDFHLVDVRVTLEAHIGGGVATDEFLLSKSIRPVLIRDIPELKHIAQISFGTTRFHTDDHFPRVLSDRMYEIWIEKLCNDPAKSVFVAYDQEMPIGFVACSRLANQSGGQIDLIAVSPDYSRQGVGEKLVRRSLDYFAQQKLETVKVVTQGQNLSAQRLYQRCGFLTSSLQLWYHVWLNEPEAEASVLNWKEGSSVKRPYA